MRSIVRLFMSSSVIVGAALAMAELFAPNVAVAADAAPFKIGLMLPLSGPGAGGAAEGGQQGVALAVKEINAGRLAARPFEVVTVDDASDPRTASAVCNRLVLEEKVDAVISQGATPSRMACNQVLARAGVPHLAALSGPGGMCIPNLYMIGPETSQTLLTLIKQAIKDGAGKLYFVGSDYSVIRDVLPVVTKAAEANGAAVIGSSFSPFGATDFSSDIGKIAAAKPDIVVMMLVGADAVTFSRQFGSDDRVKGVKRADFLMTEKVLRSLGAAGGDIYSAASYFASIPGDANTAFKAAMRKEFGDKATPDAWAVMAYNAVYALARAVATPTSGAKEALEALPKIQIDGPQGHIAISGKYIATPIFVARTSDKGAPDVIASYAEIPPAPHCK